jgi:hypothetical protein
MQLTIELVKVAGMATIIHHTNPVRKSFPFPLTKLLTSRPSSSATYRLIIVRRTRNILWLMMRRNSLLLHPGITIFNNRNRFLKNSRFNSTFFLDVASPSAAPVAGRFRSSACRKVAAFCSAMAFRIRLMSATKRVRYTARDILVRFCRYRSVRSFTMLLMVCPEMACVEESFDNAAMTIAVYSFVMEADDQSFGGLRMLHAPDERQ